MFATRNITEYNAKENNELTVSLLCGNERYRKEGWIAFFTMKLIGEWSDATQLSWYTSKIWLDKILICSVSSQRISKLKQWQCLVFMSRGTILTEKIALGIAQNSVV